MELDTIQTYNAPQPLERTTPAQAETRADLLAKGWCPRQVESLERKFSATTFAFFSTIERSPFRLNVHEACRDRDQCVAFNTDPSDYEVKHVMIDCMCSMVVTPHEQLTKVLRAGAIPLIEIEQGNDTGTSWRLQVHPRTRKSQYVAVSHVWADGLGNPFANALPLCQIRKLYEHLFNVSQVLAPSSTVGAT
jgi:hypothetical protein